jgi:hypothetical protein
MLVYKTSATRSNNMLISFVRLWSTKGLVGAIETFSMVTSSCLLLLAGWQKASCQHWQVGRKGIYRAFCFDVRLGLRRDL